MTDGTPERFAGLSERQQARMTARLVRRTWSASTARDAVGEIPPGAAVFGLSKGRWSLLDLLDYLLDLCADDPADVVISTWTAGLADAEAVWQWLRDGRIRSCRLLIDFTVVTRAPAYCEAFRARFGDHAIRLTDNHCKFVIVRGGGRNFTIVTSMNLNENLRMEWYEVADDVERAAYLLDVVDLIWREVDPVEQWTRRPIDHKRALAALAEDNAAEAAAEQERRQKFWYGDGAWDRDLRRTGLTFQP